MIEVVKVPKHVAAWAEEESKREFLPPSQIVRSLMQRGLAELQRRGHQRDDNKR